MREFINKHGIVVAVSTIVVAAILYYFLWPRKPGGASKWAFYVDDKTGAESQQLATEIPPIGENLVQEIKIRCGSKIKVAYYMKFTPEAHDKLVQLSHETLTGTDPRSRQDQFTKLENLKQRVRRAGKMVRLPGEGNRWVMASTPEGVQVTNSAQCPGNETAYAVSP